MVVGVLMSLFFTIVGLYFAPSALGYALSQQLYQNRWLAIFQFRKVDSLNSLFSLLSQSDSFFNPQTDLLLLERTIPFCYVLICAFFKADFQLVDEKRSLSLSLCIPHIIYMFHFDVYYNWLDVGSWLWSPYCLADSCRFLKTMAL
jgi:hypothetical protein